MEGRGEWDKLNCLLPLPSFLHCVLGKLSSPIKVSGQKRLMILYLFSHTHPRTVRIAGEISSLMMEAVRTSETSVDNHFTRQYNPEDSSEHQREIPC
jgi:hypothetical protein